MPGVRGGEHRKLFTRRGFDHYRCNGCRFIFVNPRLNEEGARRYYGSPYYANYLHYCEIPASEGGEPFCRTFGAKLPAFVDRLRELCPSGSVLDAGCGPGALLARFPADRYDRVGLDYNPTAAAFARDNFGLRILRDIDELDGNERFDLVTATEVIEHVEDPRRFVESLVGLLKPDGHLVLTTPNIECPEFHLFGRQCHHLVAPSHVNFFSIDTLGRLGRRCGLEVADWWYREGKFTPWRALHFWLKSRKRVLDCWSPDGPTRVGENIAYRRPEHIGSDTQPPPWHARPVAAPNDDRPNPSPRPALRLARTLLGWPRLDAKDQMVMVFRLAGSSRSLDR